MKPLLVGAVLIALSVSGVAQTRRDGWIVWKLPATIEALQDVTVLGDATTQKRGILYVSGGPNFVPFTVPKGTRFQMIRIYGEGQVSFWDAMILAACLHAGVHLLLSEDVPGGEVSGLRVVNPFG